MTDESAIPVTEPQASHRLRLFLCLVPAMLAAIAFVHVARGDELKFYMKPLLRSQEVWPLLNTTVVHHGISPLFLWLAAGIGQLAGGAVVGGRLLSAASLAAVLGFAAGCRGALRQPLMVALLLHPLIVVYGARAHPFVPAVAMLATGLMLRRRHLAASLLLLAGAAHFQVFMAGFAPLWGWQEEHGPAERLRRAVWGCIAATAGIVLNWVLIGGMYPASFYESDLYINGFAGAGPRDPTWAYFFLLPAFCGALLWLVGTATLTRRRLLVAGALGVLLAAALSATKLPTGPFGSLLKHAGRAGTAVLWPALVVALTLGLARLPRDRWLLAAACACGAAIMQPVPAYYDRFAWWMAAVGLMVWGTAPQREDPLATGRVAVCLALGVWGSVVYALFGRL